MRVSPVAVALLAALAAERGDAFGFCVGRDGGGHTCDRASRGQCETPSSSLTTRQQLQPGGDRSSTTSTALNYAFSRGGRQLAVRRYVYEVQFPDAGHKILDIPAAALTPQQQMGGDEQLAVGSTVEVVSIEPSLIGAATPISAGGRGKGHRIQRGVIARVRVRRADGSMETVATSDVITAPEVAPPTPPSEPSPLVQLVESSVSGSITRDAPLPFDGMSCMAFKLEQLGASTAPKSAGSSYLEAMSTPVSDSAPLEVEVSKDVAASSPGKAAGSGSYLESMSAPSASASAGRPTIGGRPSSIGSYLDNMDDGSKRSILDDGPTDWSKAAAPPPSSPPEISPAEPVQSAQPDISAATTVVAGSSSADAAKGKTTGSYLDSMAAPASASPPPTGGKKPKSITSYLDSVANNMAERSILDDGPIDWSKAAGVPPAPVKPQVQAEEPDEVVATAAPESVSSAPASAAAVSSYLDSMAAPASSQTIKPSGVGSTAGSLSSYFDTMSAPASILDDGPTDWSKAAGAAPEPAAPKASTATALVAEADDVVTPTKATGSYLDGMSAPAAASPSSPAGGRPSKKSMSSYLESMTDTSNVSILDEGPTDWSKAGAAPVQQAEPVSAAAPEVVAGSSISPPPPSSMAAASVSPSKPSCAGGTNLVSYLDSMPPSPTAEVRDVETTKYAVAPLVEPFGPIGSSMSGPSATSEVAPKATASYLDTMNVPETPPPSSVSASAPAFIDADIVEESVPDEPSSYIDADIVELSSGEEEKKAGTAASSYLDAMAGAPAESSEPSPPSWADFVPEVLAEPEVASSYLGDIAPAPTLELGVKEATAATPSFPAPSFPAPSASVSADSTPPDAEAVQSPPIVAAPAGSAADEYFNVDVDVNTGIAVRSVAEEGGEGGGRPSASFLDVVARAFRHPLGGEALNRRRPVKNLNNCASHATGPSLPTELLTEPSADVMAHRRPRSSAEGAGLSPAGLPEVDDVPVAGDLAADFAFKATGSELLPYDTFKIERGEDGLSHVKLYICLD